MHDQFLLKTGIAAWWCLAGWLALGIVPADAAGPIRPPEDFTIPSSSHSPDGRYGVTVPTLGEHPDNEQPEPHNEIVDLPTGRVLATIHAGTGWDRMNRGGVLPARWSPDSTLLLWEVEGRFCPDALALLKLDGGKVAWEIDVLETVQQAILTHTHQAAPKRYATAKKYDEGNGSAYPDGFNVNVRVEGDKERGGWSEDVKGKPVSLPLRVHAELTSNPKEIERPKNAQLDAELDGVIDAQGRFSVSRFALRKKPFSSATSTSWLELTDPGAAAHAPMEYGDVVSLQGKVTARKDAADIPIYILTLKRKISVLPSADTAAEDNVTEVRLLGFEELYALPGTPDLKGRTFDIEGTLGHAAGTGSRPTVTLKVHNDGSAG